MDKDHFGQACNPELELPADVAELPRPIFGYIGVVDERLDYELLGKLADATTGSVVMVGPSTKVDPADLPAAAQISIGSVAAITRSFPLTRKVSTFV